MRIITCSKYNAHTSPIFKALEILKVEDIFKINLLKFQFKSENDSLPKYFSQMFTTTTPTHEYNTRNCNTSRPSIPRTDSAINTIRHHIPRFIENVPDMIKEKIHTHSFKGFVHYAKLYYIRSYPVVCDVENCYICSR